MEAIILAGGFGTRLKPLTYTRAKPLLPILNKPMIMHLIEILPEKVDKVILAVNYKKEQLEKYFKENNCGRKIIINDEPKPLGTGGAVKYAEKHITDSFLVLNSDIICSLDLKKMIDFHRRKNAVSTISLWPVENVSEFGVADVKKDGMIAAFVEKPQAEEAPSNLINAGAYFLDPMILDYIETGKLVSMEKEIFPRIIKDTGRFYGYRFQGYWMDIGRISSYLDANCFLLKKNKIRNSVGENCEIHGSINDTCLGNNVTIREHSNVKSSVVYDNVEISRNSVLFNCVIGENCRIGENSVLKNVVVGDNEKIKANSNLENKSVWTQPIPEGYPSTQVGNIIKQ